MNLSQNQALDITEKDLICYLTFPLKFGTHKLFLDEEAFSNVTAWRWEEITSNGIFNDRCLH